jgi:hypothetical protein
MVNAECFSDLLFRSADRSFDLHGRDRDPVTITENVIFWDRLAIDSDKVIAGLFALHFDCEKLIDSCVISDVDIICIAASIIVDE